MKKKNKRTFHKKRCFLFFRLSLNATLNLSILRPNIFDKKSRFSKKFVEFLKKIFKELSDKNFQSFLNNNFPRKYRPLNNRFFKLVDFYEKFVKDLKS